jgi:hypothetical protein
VLQHNCPSSKPDRNELWWSQLVAQCSKERYLNPSTLRADPCSKTIGPHRNAMRPRSSATAGFACATCGRISKESFTLSPDLQRRRIARHCPAVNPPISLPPTRTLFCFDQAGMRTNKVSSSGEAGATDIRQCPPKGTVCSGAARAEFRWEGATSSPCSLSLCRIEL